MKPSSISPDRHTARLHRDEMNKLIDLDQYPIDRLDEPEGKSLIARCQNDLDRDAAATLPGFLRAEALDGLKAEAKALVPGSRRFARAPRVTFPEGDDADGTDLGKRVRARKHPNAYN